MQRLRHCFSRATAALFQPTDTRQCFSRVTAAMFQPSDNGNVSAEQLRQCYSRATSALFQLRPTDTRLPITLLERTCRRATDAVSCCAPPTPTRGAACPSPHRCLASTAAFRAPSHTWHCRCPANTDEKRFPHPHGVCLDQHGRASAGALIVILIDPEEEKCKVRRRQTAKTSS